VVRYLQSRLNDLRDENLSLRDRYKTSAHAPMASAAAVSHHQEHMINVAKTFPDSDYQNTSCLTIGVGNQSMLNKSSCVNEDEGITPSMLYTPSIDGDARLESKNELLQQKLNELQKLQMQLNNVQS
jgi:hypothetical protein